MKKKLDCILLIDDDEPTNYYNSLIIEETGYADHVHVVQSGKKALEYLDANLKSEKMQDSAKAAPSW